GRQADHRRPSSSCDLLADQLVEQRRVCLRQGGGDRAFRDSASAIERLGDLAVGEIGVVAQEQNQTPLRRQRPNSRRESRVTLLVENRQIGGNLDLHAAAPLA